MNTTEKIVESYFRLCRDCFTMADLKVAGGNNRQIDLLAVNLKTEDQYHVEVSVTHQENWCPTPEDLCKNFERKFFGTPAKREGKNTDYTLGKNYEKQIREAYVSVGFDPEKIRRIWVCWTVKNGGNLDEMLQQYFRTRNLSGNGIEVMSFRDEILPELQEKVATANYEDDALRTLSLFRQFEKQRGAVNKNPF